MHSFMKALLITIAVPAAVIAAEVPRVGAGDEPDRPSAARAKDPLTANSKFVNLVVQKFIVRAAELMPEEHYGFRPVASVRSFGQIVGHIADAQYRFCSVALGEKAPMPRVEKTKTSKADLVAALNEAFAYCGRVYLNLDDTNGAEIVDMHGHPMPRLGVLNANQAHTMEHYGNLVTYLRMKDLVPPTSDAEFMKQLRK